MNVKTLDGKGLDLTSVTAVPKLDGSKAAELHKMFNDIGCSPNSIEHGISIDRMNEIEVRQDTNRVLNWLHLTPEDVKKLDIPSAAEMKNIVRQMYEGIDLPDGEKGLGLEKIEQWKLDENSPYYDINLKQQAGYAAEVVSTVKDNLKEKMEGSGNTVWRTEDLPEEFEHNDQYVDKVIKDANGNIIEKIQVKFVGKDAESCLKKLESKKYDKYFEEGRVDKIEIPSDYYDEIRNKGLISQDIEKYRKQLNDAIEKGNDELAAKYDAKIKRCEQIDEMLKKSEVTNDEAVEARLHAQEYTKRTARGEVAKAANRAGEKAGLEAAALTAAVSTVDNVQKVMNGEITPQEAVLDIAKDTGTAGAVGYATAFVSEAASSAMNASSHTLIRSLGNAGVPAAVISYGVESFDSVVDYAQGDITGQELANELGKNAAEVAGGAVGSAIAGAVVGSVVPGAGTVVGFAAGLVGGMVGTALASEAYATAVENAPEVADKLAAKAKETATSTVKMAQNVGTEAAATVKTALNDFAAGNRLPFSL